jgi:hypothetical protein
LIFSPPDYADEPWKHPAVWKSHLVRMTCDYPESVPFAVASCECGWTFREKIDGVKSSKARFAAVRAHWHDVIKASTVPA